MVAEACVSCGPHVGVCVRREEELTTLVGKVVRGFAVWTVIDPPCRFSSDKLAALVCTDSDMHQERGSLWSADVVLLHIDAHVDRTLACNEGYRKVGLICRRNFVTKRSTHVVLDDPYL